ncbi:MAG: Possibl zinc metallo-peptidase [Syntrophorhabdus sp. PtaU1.Bin002]|nr:MAG: Possibl zinc metallo-peptidase [Syntrophorhabdus sp. PtaU1.Bin002]
MKISEKDFDRIVEQAIQRIPSEIQEHLNNLVISVRRRPSRKMLKEMGLPDGEPLLGLYQGVSLVERSITSPPLFPDTILLFQEPLQEMCETFEELEEEVEITIVHEVAHFIGLSEERLEELGYG